MLILAFASHSAYAQTDTLLNDDDIERSPFLYGDLIPVNCLDKPYIQNVSFVRLSNGTVLIEAFVYGRPSYTGKVYISETRNSSTVMTDRGNGRYEWIGTLPEGGAFYITAYNGCTYSWEVLTKETTICTATDIVFVPNPQFYVDLDAWRASGEPGGYINFLNGLAYLTHTQRWAIFQKTAMDCEVIPADVINGFIPNTFSSFLEGKCDCQSVLMTKFVNEERVLPTGPSEVEASNKTRREDNGRGKFNYAWLDTEGGASKIHAMSISDRRGGGQEKRYNAGDSVRTSAIRVTLLCLKGETGPNDPKCECSKLIQASYQYDCRWLVDADDRRGTLEKYGSASVAEFAYFGSHQLGDPILVDNIMATGGARGWGRSINDDWIGNYFRMVTTIAGAALILADTTQATINQVGAIAAAGQSVADFLTTNFYDRTGGLGIDTDAGNLQGVLDTRVNSEKTTEVILGSGDQLQVIGKRSYHSRAEVHSSHYLAVNLPSNDPDIVDEGCCSQHGAVYLSKALSPNFPSINYVGRIRSFFGDWGWPSTDFPDDQPEANGLARDNSRNAMCNQVIVENLRVNIWSTSTRKIYDTNGRLLLTIAPNQVVDLAKLTDGTYAVTATTARGHTEE